MMVTSNGHVQANVFYKALSSCDNNDRARCQKVLERKWTKMRSLDNAVMVSQSILKAEM